MQAHLPATGLTGSGASAPFPPPLAAEGAVETAGVAIPGTVDVAVIGAGVIGLSIAWRLALRGLDFAAQGGVARLPPPKAKRLSSKVGEKKIEKLKNSARKMSKKFNTRQ